MINRLLHETLGQRLHVAVPRVNCWARVGAWPRVQRDPPSRPPLLLPLLLPSCSGGDEQKAKEERRSPHSPGSVRRRVFGRVPRQKAPGRRTTSAAAAGKITELPSSTCGSACFLFLTVTFSPPWRLNHGVERWKSRVAACQAPSLPAFNINYAAD